MADVTLTGSTPIVVTTDVPNKEITVSSLDGTLTVKGVVQLATNAETILGTVTDKAVTGAGLKQLLDNLDIEIGAEKGSPIIQEIFTAGGSWTAPYDCIAFIAVTGGGGNTATPSINSCPPAVGTISLLVNVGESLSYTVGAAANLRSTVKGGDSSLSGLGITVTAQGGRSADYSPTYVPQATLVDSQNKALSFTNYPGVIAYNGYIENPGGTLDPGHRGVLTFTNESSQQQTQAGSVSIYYVKAGGGGDMLVDWSQGQTINAGISTTVNFTIPKDGILIGTMIGAQGILSINTKQVIGPNLAVSGTGPYPVNEGDSVALKGGNTVVSIALYVPKK